MPRNLDGRVEAMVPIENPTVHQQVLDEIMGSNLKDDLQSWDLDADGHYDRRQPVGEGFACHDFFMNNPSLSGRGSAMRDTASTPRLVLDHEKE
jgi:polyphosphate kinase